ncbi:MAG: hypothetical protein HRF47_19265, partial [Chloroflexota bacterium]
MKRIATILLIVVLLFVAIGVSNASASGVFSCGSSTPASGISCEAGAGYIRWTLTNVPMSPQAFAANYALSATAPQHALVRFDMTYTKKSVSENPRRRQIGVHYYAVDVSSNTYDLPGFIRYIGPTYSPYLGEAADDSVKTFQDDITYYALIQPGSNKQLKLDTTVLTTLEENTISGVIEIQIQDSQPGLPYFNGSPLNCTVGEAGYLTYAALHTNRADAVAHAGGGEGYLNSIVLPDSIGCYTGGNYIMWTLDHIYDSLILSYLADASLNGLDAELIVSGDMCRMVTTWDNDLNDTARFRLGTPYGVSTIFNGSLNYHAEVSACAHQDQQWTFQYSDAGMNIFRFDDDKGGVYFSGFVMLRFPTLQPGPTSTPNWTATPTQSPSPTPTVTATATTSGSGGGGGGGGG